MKGWILEKRIENMAEFIEKMQENKVSEDYLKHFYKEDKKFITLFCEVTGLKSEDYLKMYDNKLNLRKGMN